MTTEPALPCPKKSVAPSGFPAGHTALCTGGRIGDDLHCRGHDMLDIGEAREFEEISHLPVHGALPPGPEPAADTSGT